MSYLMDHSFAWRHLLQVLPDEIVIVDENGLIQYVSERVETLTGYRRDELMNVAVEVLVPAPLRAGHIANRTNYTQAPSVRKMNYAQELRIRCKDGRELEIDIGISPVTIDGALWIVAALRDKSAADNVGVDVNMSIVTAKLSSAAMLAESEERFRLAFDDNMAPMIFTDLEDCIFAANDSFCQLIGRTKEEILGNDSTLFTLPEDVGITEDVHRRISQGEAGQTRYTKRYLHKDGRLITVEVSKSPARDSTGKTLYYVISERDVTDRVRRSRVLELLARVNKLAMDTADEAAFLQQLCEVLVSEGGYALAWIGAAPVDGADSVDIICSAGAVDYLDEDLVSWWGTKESGRGPTGTALRTGQSQVISDLASNSMYEPWRERASRFGFGSSIAIAERLGERFGALCIYDRHLYAFDEITVKGLEEIVRAAKSAITHVRSVQKTQAALEETTLAVEALRETERALTNSEERFRLAFEDNMAPMVLCNRDDLAVAVNDAFCDMVGFSREELLGHDSTRFTFPEDVGITEKTHVRLVSHEVDQVRYTKRYLRKDGRVIIAEVSRSAAQDADGKTLYFLSSERDVTEERALTAQLSHQALHDPLTGLPNRALLEDRLSRAHARVARDGGIGALLLLDLDDFKEVNDTHGHLVGDKLLVGIARRFELVTRSSDTLCRLGGDEFLYLAEGLTSVAQIEEVAARLLDVLTEPFSLDGVMFEQHASIGIMVWDQTSTDSTEIIQNADVALYEAKSHAKGRHVVFTPSMHERVVGRVAIVKELRHALHAGELAMHYQPIVNLATTEVVGFEALMRWQHPERGWVPPVVFIPMAEQSELILELGSFALREAVAAAISWGPASGQSNLPYVTVNLSAHQFHDPDMVAKIEASLATGGLAPGRLILEITESAALLEAADAVNTLAHLHRLGVGIALDDFGTGFSSLSYIVTLDPKIIKIDQSFVRPRQPSDRNDALLKMIVSLGNSMQMTMLAEGIETPAQLEQLRQLGCELGQGYLFSRAVPADQAAAMVGKSFVIRP